MKVLKRPLVYVGPTLTPAQVSATLPDAIVRPSLRRGDLYRDRLLRGTVFLILDGVFFQDLAVPPREIRDVVEDGALVIGASSAGAMRAAECWPFGMRGVGAVYRLFRAGILASDDEVAVTFDSESRFGSSLALVNVRYALRQALRRRLLEPAAAARVLEVACATFYAERRWLPLLRAAGVGSQAVSLAEELASYDIKRKDAFAALGKLRRWSAEDPSFYERPRRSDSFGSTEQDRERSHEPIPSARLRELRAPFCCWLALSGRFRRYVSWPEGHAASQSGVEDHAQGWLEALGVSARVESESLTANRGLASLAEYLAAPQGKLYDRLLRSIAQGAALDAELFRFRAFTEACERAQQLGHEPSQHDRRQAEEELALAHAAPSFEALAAALDERTRQLLLSHRDEVAAALLAKRQCA